MTYTDFVRRQLETFKIGQPIYTRTVSEKFAPAFGLSDKEAAAAVSVAFKRIMGDASMPNLRFYQKGIYYLTAATPFGEVGINTEQLIADKYLLPYEGYETGYTALLRFGLTTQLPKQRCIATNRARGSIRKDEKLGILIRPPKAKITKENKAYLQFLDVLDIMENAPVDVDQPYAILGQYAVRTGLEYERLLALADRYYNQKTVLRLAHTASEGGK